MSNTIPSKAFVVRTENGRSLAAFLEEGKAPREWKEQGVRLTVAELRDRLRDAAAPCCESVRLTADEHIRNLNLILDYYEGKKDGYAPHPQRLFQVETLCERAYRFYLLLIGAKDYCNPFVTKGTTG